MEKELPLSAMERIIAETGVERISDSAKIALREVLIDEIKEITRKAHQFSKHAGRKTILKEDVRLASK